MLKKLLLAAVTAGLAPAAMAMSVPSGNALTFDVIRKGKDIGDYTIRFRPSGDAVTVNLKTDIRVKVPIIGMSVYSFEQTSEEAWKGGKLQSVKSTTDDNGTKSAIAVAGSGLVPGSLWDAEITGVSKALNTIDGKPMAIAVRKVGMESVRTGSGTVQATHYTISGGIKRDVWFDGDGNLAHVAFTADDGSHIDYVRR